MLILTRLKQILLKRQADVIYDKPNTFCLAQGYPENITANLRILAELQGLGVSMEIGRPLAADGSPIPWYTYPAIEYLSQFDTNGLHVFEYGCGNSSLFWARKGAQVWSVEHDAQWHARMSEQSSLLRGLILRTDKSAYAQAVNEPGGMFDIIIIDGVWRNECAAEAMSKIKPGGLIILDNSDWYTDVSDFLRTKGYFQVDFNGFGPINPYCWTTSIFLPWASPLMTKMRQPQPIGGIPVTKGEMW
ncbi:MAG: hypothetical protein Q7J24_05875 [Desulfomicrobium sp.]|nr:hypothetical protein [Desulfomicrobium sp.]